MDYNDLRVTTKTADEVPGTGATLLPRAVSASRNKGVGRNANTLRPSGDTIAEPVTMRKPTASSRA